MCRAALGPAGMANRAMKQGLPSPTVGSAPTRRAYGILIAWAATMQADIMAGASSGNSRQLFVPPLGAGRIGKMEQ